jgi:hypothetical protein
MGVAGIGCTYGFGSGIVVYNDGKPVLLCQMYGFPPSGNEVLSTAIIGQAQRDNWEYMKGRPWPFLPVRIRIEVGTGNA